MQEGDQGEHGGELVVSRTAWSLTAIQVSPTRFGLFVGALLLSPIEQKLDAVLRYTLTGAPPILFAHVRRRLPILDASVEVIGAEFRYFIRRQQAVKLVHRHLGASAPLQKNLSVLNNHFPLISLGIIPRSLLR